MSNQLVKRRPEPTRPTPLASIIELHRQGQIPAGSPLEAQIMAMAKGYGRRHGLVFDGTMNGAIRLAEEAERTVRDHVERKRKIKGRRGVYDDIQRVN